MKKLRRTVSILLSLIMVFSMFTIVPLSASAAENAFVKVTSEPTDWSGEYLLVYEVDGAPTKVFNSAANLVSGANTLQAAFGVSDGNIDYDDTTAAAAVTIAKIGDSGYYSIKTASGKYIGRDINNNGIDESESTLDNTIAWDNGSVKITSAGGAIMRYNTGSSQFRYYKTATYTNQQPIQLYKLTAVEPEPEPTVAPTEAPADTITVYFTDAQNFGDVNVYYWPGVVEWPGTAATKTEVNDLGQQIYSAEIPADVEGVIFNGNGRQTVDITEGIADDAWWYTDGTIDEAGHYNVALVPEEEPTEPAVGTIYDSGDVLFADLNPGDYIAVGIESCLDDEFEFSVILKAGTYTDYPDGDTAFDADFTAEDGMFDVGTDTTNGILCFDDWMDGHLFTPFADGAIANAFYVESIEDGTITLAGANLPTTPAEEPTTPAEEPTDEPVAGSTYYYLIGTMTDWKIDEDYRMFRNTSAGTFEYVLGADLVVTDEFKVVAYDGVNKTWFPEGTGNNYGENGEITVDGEYTIYFRPNYDGGDDWFEGCIYVVAPEVEPTEPAEEPTTPAEEPTTPAEEPTTPAEEPTEPIVGASTFYLVGSFTEWQTDDAYILTKNAEAEGEYVIAGVELLATDEFKIVETNSSILGFEPVWYPGGFDNNYVVAADGVYDVYFRPNYDGGEDWYYNCIYAADVTPEEPTEPAEEPTEPAEEPTTPAEEPTTPAEEPTTPAEEPTDEPVAGSTYYYLIGTITDWQIDEDYRMFRNTSAGTFEYVLGADLVVTDEFKVVAYDGVNKTWFPEGYGNNYGENGEITVDGEYTIYFRPNYDGDEDWFYGCIYVVAPEVEPTEPAEEPTTPAEEPTTPAEEPTTPAEEPTEPIVGASTFYLVGSFTEWQTDDAYILTKNAEAEGEYVIAGVELLATDEFKIVETNSSILGFEPVWYPDGTDNNYVVTADGVYDVYFRPSYDGGEDWYYNCIYAADVTPEEPTEPAEEPTTPAEEPTTPAEEPTTPAEEPTTPAEEPTDEPVAGSTYYYLIGTMTEWQIDEDYRMFRNTSAGTFEYVLGADLVVTDEFKVVAYDGVNMTWFPEGTGNNYGENGEITVDGEYTIYFRPNYDGGEDWFYNCIYVVAPEVEPTEPAEEPTTPAEEPTEPAAEGAKYYVIGTFTEWAVDEAYELTKNEEVEYTEYLFEGLRLTTTDEFKVIKVEEGADNVWYPDGTNNNYGQNGEITADGTYTVYFTPDYDGGDDWFYGCIYVGAESEEPTEPAEEPTEEPTEPAEEPTTPAEEPTEPAAEGAKYYVIGTFTEWAVDEAYELTKNEEVEYTEYLFEGLRLTTTDEFKVIKVEEGADNVWYPDGTNNNYGQNGEITADGTYTVYFTPDYDGGDDWFYGCIYVGAESEEPTEPAEEPTEEPTEPVVTPGASTFYLVGTFTEWQTDDAYILTANAEAEGEYMIAGVELKAGDEFKVVETNGSIFGFEPVWYPDGTDNNYEVAADGVYDVYFRPNYDGGDDWYYNVIYVADSSIILCGDADGDGEVTILDVTAIQRWLAGLPTDFNGAAADVDGDGDVTILDATYIQRWLVAFDDGYPIGEYL